MMQSNDIKRNMQEEKLSFKYMWAKIILQSLLKGVFKRTLVLQGILGNEKLKMASTVLIINKNKDSLNKAEFFNLE